MTRPSRLTLLPLALLLSTPVWAEQPVGSYYLGLGAGKSGLDASIFGTACDCSDELPAAKITAGYQVTTGLGVEVNVQSLGALRDDHRQYLKTPDGYRDADLDISAWGVSLVGRAPLKNHYSLFGSVGFEQRSLTFDLTETIPAINQKTVTNVDGNDVGVVMGVGIAERLDHFDLRLAYEFHKDVDFAQIPSGGDDIGVMMLEVDYHF